jgi:hypothetical protein
VSEIGEITATPGSRMTAFPPIADQDIGLSIEQASAFGNTRRGQERPPWARSRIGSFGMGTASAMHAVLTMLGSRRITPRE